MPLTITYEDNWTFAYSSIANSRYKIEHNTEITYSDQIEIHLNDLCDLNDYHANATVNILQKAFRYDDFNEMSQLHIIKLTMNDKGILCLKIAAPHPQSTDACLVGTFTLDPSMKIRAFDKVDTVLRKIPRLTLPNHKLPLPTYTDNTEQSSKENTSPNSRSNTPTKSNFSQQARSSYRTLPVSDELLAKLLAVQPSTSTPENNVSNTPIACKK